MYGDEDDQEEGPKSSFTTYLAEGDVLFKQSEYKKALESYSLALELQPGDKVCLVARSKCYLQLGDTAKALEDAEESLKEDKEYYKGLYHKAEALYAKGDFEHALVFYHRGNKLRPELQEFRLGIQKAQEAISNSIGEEVDVKLENKGDLSFFQKQDDLKKSKGYTKPKPQRAQPQHQTTRGKTQKKPATSDKSCKELLGELYADKEYLEKLLNDHTTSGVGHSQGEPEFVQGDQNKKVIHDLVLDGLQYLDKQVEFWSQQQPLYARKKKKPKPKPKAQEKPADATKFIIRSLEEIDQKLADGDAEESLKQAQSVMKTVQKLSDKDLPNKQDIIGNLHSCIGNAYLEMDNSTKALDHHKKDLAIAKKTENSDGKSRALDNLGRCYAKQGDYAQAIDCWMEKIPMSKTALESTWLYHEVGRCHLEMKNYQDSKEFGQKSLTAAREAEDQVWQLNATVLISQANVKIGELTEALESFQQALDLAKILGDDAAEAAISKAINDVNDRIAQDVRKDSDSGKEDETTEIQSEGEKKESDTDDKPEAEQPAKETQENAASDEDKPASDTEQDKDKAKTKTDDESEPPGPAE